MSGLWMLRSRLVPPGGRPVLEGASLSIAAGEVVGVLRAERGGQTTLIRAGLGLVEAQVRSSLAAKPESPLRTRTRGPRRLPAPRTPCRLEPASLARRGPRRAKPAGPQSPEPGLGGAR